MSHICGIDGRFAVQVMDKKGDRRVRAQELLSPFGGNASAAK